MAGEADLQPSKNAKNAATCRKKQGADSKKKKQSCSNNETSHKEKKVNDNCVNGNEEEVMKMKDDKSSDSKGTVIIENRGKCNSANHKRKDALNKETDSFIMGVASSEECSSNDNKGKDGINDGEGHGIKIDNIDVIEKEIVNKCKIEGIDKLDLKNQVMIKEKVIHANNESQKKENEDKAVSVDREDVKKNGKECATKEDCANSGGNTLSSTEEKDLSNKNSPKKRQFGYNYRGRGFYGNNRGRNFNWRGGWGHNYNRYPNPRMMNNGYRGHNRLCNNYSESAPGHLKASSPMQPEVPPAAFIGSLQPVYFESQMKYQDCYYFPQVWPPQQPGQTLLTGVGTTTYYQGSNDISGAQDNTGQAELASRKPYAGNDNQSADMPKQKAGIIRRENLDHQKPPSNQELGQSETSNQMNAEANQAIEGPGVPSNIIASVFSNPLFELGKSAEQDKQLVQTFAGIEMRPSVQLPPDYGVQWFFIQYGAALPPSVIPVMVLPFINAADSAGNQYQHPGQDGNGGHEQLFTPPQSLLPSYFNNGHVQTPSPVDTYQPVVNAWTNQTMNPMAAGNQEYFIPQNHSSQTHFHAENKF